MQDSISTVNHWLSQRVPGAQLDAEGTAGLQRDPATRIMLEVPKGSDLCHFYAPVAALPEYDPEAALYAALELNRFGRPLGSCWLAWDPDLSMLTLCHNLLVNASDTITFNNTLDNFLAALDNARRQFQPDHSSARYSD